MITALSYIGAHWLLILSVIGGTIALGAFAWFAKNWKAALAAVVLVSAGLVYQHADLGGYKRRINEEKAAEISLLQDRIATMSLVASEDTQRSVMDAQLNSTLKDLSSATPHNDGPCLDAAAAHRVWAIRGTSIPGATPLPARRVSNVLPWGHKRP